ncbi:translation initiation factor IF-2-like [Phyllostomus hastatus]|uniref:translation initiation factor IF-2-like n=1 Tax=Phyllostomus hastatus TaxID=9423 RepID=UPI001E6846E2|nr:translation initiation factor IF-2-like [Phyllostomus hastatus]
MGNDELAKAWPRAASNPANAVVSALQSGRRRRRRSQGTGTETGARAADARPALRLGPRLRAAPRGFAPGSPLAPGTNSGQSHDAGAARSASLPGLAGPETPEANFPRAWPATGARRRPVAAAFAQPGMPENLANFGPDPPARRENSGRSEGSVLRPFVSRRFPGTERKGARWPQGDGLPSAPRRAAETRVRAKPGPVEDFVYSVAPEFNAFRVFEQD